MATATDDFMNMKRSKSSLATLVKQLRDVVYEGPSSYVASSVDAKLSLQIVAASEDELGDALVVAPDLSDHYCVFFSSSRINNKLVLKLSLIQQHWLHDRVLRILCVGILFFVRKLLLAVEAPSVELPTFADGK